MQNAGHGDGDIARLEGRDEATDRTARQANIGIEDQNIGVVAHRRHGRVDPRGIASIATCPHDARADGMAFGQFSRLVRRSIVGNDHFPLRYPLKARCHGVEQAAERIGAIIGDDHHGQGAFSPPSAAGAIWLKTNHPFPPC
ncbi:hypothetical protein FQZ97_930680 [compost metagenome]